MKLRKELLQTVDNFLNTHYFNSCVIVKKINVKLPVTGTNLLTNCVIKEL